MTSTQQIILGGIFSRSFAIRYITKYFIYMVDQNNTVKLYRQIPLLEIRRKNSSSNHLPNSYFSEIQCDEREKKNFPIRSKTIQRKNLKSGIQS